MDLSEERISRLHRDAPLTDVHVHPSVKAFMFRRHLNKHYCSGKAMNPLASQSDFKMLRKGGLGVIWASHFLPQREFFRDCCLLRLAGRLFLPSYGQLTKGRYFPNLIEMITRFENEVHDNSADFEVARSAADVVRIRSLGKIAVVHTVEGAHMLDGDAANLEILAGRGVALVTLSHFYPNQVAAHVDAMPKKMFIRKLCRFDFQTEGAAALTDYGREILRKMGELRIIVDVAHCSPAARQTVFGELSPDRPVVATHVGAAGINPHPFNLADDEIMEIARRGGGVGIILLPDVLSGNSSKIILPSLWRTLEHIRRITDSWDHVMLGTDFDGFADPPDDVVDASRMRFVTKALLEHGLSDEEAKKILGQNALRILTKGWK